MHETMIIPAKKISPRQVELAQALPDDVTTVEVIVKRNIPTATVQFFTDFVNSLPAGTRTKQDIDAQVREERDSWGEG